jgi:hypothetical protein
MTIEEAKLLYPTSKPEQFEPHGKYAVGDRVIARLNGVQAPGVIAKFWQLKNNKDTVMCRTHFDNGERG